MSKCSLCALWRGCDESVSVMRLDKQIIDEVGERKKKKSDVRQRSRNRKI